MTAELLTAIALLCRAPDAGSSGYVVVSELKNMEVKCQQALLKCTEIAGDEDYEPTAVKDCILKGKNK